AARFPRRELGGYFSVKPCRSFIVTPTYKLLALDARMSLPGPGVLLVTIGSTEASKNIGCSPLSTPSSDSLFFNGNFAPPFCAAAAAAANASGVVFSTNLRAVRLLYGPVLIQNNLV